MNIQFAVAAACMILCLFPDRVLARQEQSRVDCGTPDHCVRSLYEYVKANEPISGLPSPVERIIHKLADYGDAVVPSLVDLLADPDVEVTNMAGAALREIESIEPRHLPQIIEGLDRGVHWLPAALGRIDSPEAAKEAVYRYLVSRSKPYNQEAYAVKLSGERAIPYVLEVARCREQCEAEDHQSLALLIRDFSEEKAMYTDGLSAIATDESTPEETARGVLHMIAALGPHGTTAEADLLELRATRPELSDAVDRALVGIAAKTSTEVLTRWLSEASGAFKKTSILKKIATLGPVAADAGPAVLAAMEDHNPAVRNAAGRALGYIQYCDSADEMIALLQADEMDVRLTWVLTESLGRMHVREARPALAWLAEHHWYPRVRSAATTALKKSTPVRTMIASTRSGTSEGSSLTTKFCGWTATADVTSSPRKHLQRVRQTFSDSLLYSHSWRTFATHQRGRTRGPRISRKAPICQARTQKSEEKSSFALRKPAFVWKAAGLSVPIAENGEASWPSSRKTAVLRLFAMAMSMRSTNSENAISP